MGGLVEIKQWLHVWTEAERARRLFMLLPPAQAIAQPNPVGEDACASPLPQIPPQSQPTTQVLASGPCCKPCVDSPHSSCSEQQNQPVHPGGACL